MQKNNNNNRGIEKFIPMQKSQEKAEVTIKVIEAKGGLMIKISPEDSRKLREKGVFLNFEV